MPCAWFASIILSPVYFRFQSIPSSVDVLATGVGPELSNCAMYETSQSILVLTPHQARICGGEIFRGMELRQQAGVVDQRLIPPFSACAGALDGRWTAPVRVRGAAGSNGRVRCPPSGQDHLYPAGAIDLDPLDGPGPSLDRRYGSRIPRLGRVILLPVVTTTTAMFVKKKKKMKKKPQPTVATVVASVRGVDDVSGWSCFRPSRESPSSLSEPIDESPAIQLSGSRLPSQSSRRATSKACG